jgi:5-methyltetrahydropteroyltriglutamate--homocysteine methyltransferase
VTYISGPIRREQPVELDDVRFLRANTDRRIKITLPGPFTMSQQAEDAYYGDDEALAMDLAAAVNAEVADLFAAGADVVQLDEPYLQARPEKAHAFGVKVINRALEGITGTTALHSCFGYAHVVKTRMTAYPVLAELNDCLVDQISLEAVQAKLDLSALRELPDKTIILGVIGLGDPVAETAEIVAERIRAALELVPAERLILAPDCGMKYIPRPLADAKLRALVDGAAIVRAELAG